MVSLYKQDFKFYEISENELVIFKKNSQFFEENKEQKIVFDDINVKVFSYMLPLFYGNKINKEVINEIDFSEIKKFLDKFKFSSAIATKIGSVIGDEDFYYKLDDFDRKIREEENIHRNNLIENKYSKEELIKLDKNIIYSDWVLEFIEASYSIKRDYLYKTRDDIQKEPVKPESIVKFYKTLSDNIGNGFISDLMKCSSVAVAGGSLLQCFSPYVEYPLLYYVNGKDKVSVPFSDIDLFILNTESIENTVEEIVNIIKKNFKNYERKIYDNDAAISIWVIGEKVFKIQIIKRLYNSVYQILSGFDLDASCSAIHMGNIYALPRFWRCISINANVVDNKRQSTSYLLRLKKYCNIYKISIAIPGVNSKNVNKSSDFYKLKTRNQRISNYSDEIENLGYIYKTWLIKTVERLRTYEFNYNRNKSQVHVKSINYSQFKTVNPGDQRYGVNNPTDNNIYADLIKGYLF